MSYFRRWTATPSFRRWWPVIAPLYGVGVRSFVGQRFNVGSMDPEASQAKAASGHLAELRLQEITDNDRFFFESFATRQFLKCHPKPDLTSCRLLAYNLTLLDYSGKLSTEALPIAFVLVHERPAHPRQPNGPWLAECGRLGRSM